MFTGYLWRHFTDKTCKGNKKNINPGGEKVRVYIIVSYIECARDI